MTFNAYLYEKQIAIRQSQIRHDIQQSRKRAHAGQRSMLVQSTVNRLGTLLVEVGSQLQRTGQKGEVSFHSS